MGVPMIPEYSPARTGAETGKHEVGGAGSNGHQTEATDPVVCLVPRELAPRLLRPMERWAADTGAEVIVERRRVERRAEADRREEPWPGEESGDGPALRAERRRIRNRPGRRIAERRSTLIPVPSPAGLPRRAAAEIGRLQFAERIDLNGEHLEDADSARIVTRLQAGGRDEFTVLYERYFDRVYGYLRVALNDRYEAEDAAQQVFLQVMEALPRYEIRDVPFRAWLFRIVRNYAINQLERRGRVAVEDPVELDRRRELEPIEPAVLDWLSDADLVILIGRLPQAQRQVILLRYMMDLSWTQVAQIMGRSPAAVRQLQTRALGQLRTRLAGVNKEKDTNSSARMQMARRRGPLPVLQARRNALLLAA
jgi:RNA polymerase sigma-70 factor (ECF subfamily)